MPDDAFMNSVLVTVPPDQAAYVLDRLAEYVANGNFVRFADAKPLKAPTFAYHQDGSGRTDGAILDFVTAREPMLSLDLECLLERVVQWGGDRGSSVHNIFLYPEGHAGNEPGKKRTLHGRAYGDIVVDSSLWGVYVSTFSNVMPEWGVRADRY